MTKTIAVALVAFTALTGAASASLQSQVNSYGVSINVNALSPAQRARVRLAVSSGDSTADVRRALRSIAR